MSARAEEQLEKGRSTGPTARVARNHARGFTKPTGCRHMYCLLLSREKQYWECSLSYAIKIHQNVGLQVYYTRQIPVHALRTCFQKC